MPVITPALTVHLQWHKCDNQSVDFCLQRFRKNQWVGCKKSIKMAKTIIELMFSINLTFM